jgi:propionyl-CoA synthetase
LCLFVTKDGVNKAPAKLSVELIKLIREVIGPIAAFKLVGKVEGLPRTRSGNILANFLGRMILKIYFLGKTMRKSMADFARGKTVFLPATIEDPNVFVDIRRALQELGYAMNAPDPVIATKK